MRVLEAFKFASLFYRERDPPSNVFPELSITTKQTEYNY